MTLDDKVRILVVEDEMMVAFYIEDCLTRLGHHVVGPASHVGKAQRLIETETFSIALLDINVAGEEVYPVATELQARGIPFIFLSGYGSHGLRKEWQGSPMLEKPFAPEALQKQIEETLH